MSNILIGNCLVLPMTAAAGEEKFFTGSIGISDGRIVFAGPSSGDADVFARKYSSDLTVIDGAGFVAMPGLINLHTHVAMTLMRGYADDMPLMAWLQEKIWPFEAKLTPEDIYIGAKLGVAEMLLGGTTTFVDMYDHAESVAEAVGDMHIRAVVCPALFDGNVDRFESEFEALAKKYTGGSLVTLGVAPHAPYTCSPETIGRALALCGKYGVGVHIHINETKDEAAIMHERYGKSSLQYLEELGVFDRPVVAAHCVHVNGGDIAMMKKYGVSVAHNPESNMKLASGAAPVAEMLDMGLNVGIGTDGAASNNDLDMWGEMRSASFMQKLITSDPTALPAYKVLQMATVDGARAIGMEGELGVIQIGAKADIMLVDIEKPHLYPHNDMIADLVYAAKSSDVDTVIVDGRIVVRNRLLTSIDLPALCRQSRQHAEAVKNR